MQCARTPWGPDMYVYACAAVCMYTLYVHAYPRAYVQHSWLMGAYISCQSPAPAPHSLSPPLPPPPLSHLCPSSTPSTPSELRVFLPSAPSVCLPLLSASSLCPSHLWLSSPAPPHFLGHPHPCPYSPASQGTPDLCRGTRNPQCGCVSQPVCFTRFGGDLGHAHSRKAHAQLVTPVLCVREDRDGGGFYDLGPFGGAPCAVRKVGYFGPLFPRGQGGRTNYYIPMHGTTQIPTQSKTQIMN